MKSSITTLIFILTTVLGLAQSVVIVNDEVRATAYEGKSYLVVKSLTLQPPSGGGSFTVTAATHGTFYIRMVDAASVAPDVPPSQDKNYVRTETILKQGIITEDQVANLTSISDRAIAFQYSDGIGRGSQDIVVQGSPSKKDFIQPYAYDSASRMRLDYLPYSNAVQTGVFHGSPISEQSSFYNSTSKVATDANPYSQRAFEKSPLNRVLNSYGPGAVWRSNVKKSSANFIAAGTAIPRWYINGSGLPESGTYSENILSKSTVQNDNGNQVIKYSDFRGLTVRSEQDGLVTIYVYDDIGNLRFVLPPKISGGGSPSQGTLDNWGFQYQYNDRQLLIKEKGPGTDWVYSVYDQWDRLVATQDGVQRSKNPKEWTFVKYDAFNRPIISGILTSSNDYSIMAAAVAGAGRYEATTTGSPVGYTLTGTFPLPSVFASVTESNLLTINYYDDYSFLNVSGWDAEANSFAFTNPTGFSNTNLSTVKGQMTGSKTKILGSSPVKWLNAAIYYDKKYRPIQAIQENHLAGTDRATFEYNFAGWTTKGLRSHSTSIASVGILEEHEYDHAGRVLKSWHTLDGGTRTLISSSSYNELGQLVESNLHSTDNGATFLQSVDYRYNIRGWLSQINNSTLTSDGSTNDDANDLFGMKLIYNEENPTVNGLGITSQFGGSISGIRWKTDNKKDIPKERIYGYAYDTKDRMIKGFSAAWNGSTWTDDGGRYDEENITYDDNGNLKTLRRKAKIVGSTSTLDDLSYNAAGTTSVNNQLLTVADAGNVNIGFVNGSNEQVTEYSYDSNGNMTIDLNNAVTEVKYNYLNLPEKFTLNGGTGSETSVEFTYDASGYLLRKIYKRGTTEESRVDYVNGIQYYNSALALVFTSGGRATKYNGAWEYEYFLKDQQANTRLVFGYLHDADVYKATMESYYATQEEATFKKVNTTRYQDANYNHTARSSDVPSPDRSAKLNGSVPGLEVGPGKILTIASGDKLRLEVYARYNPGSGNASDVVGSLVSAATTSMNVTLGENPAAYGAFNTHLPGYVNAITYNTGDPKAYLNYILFDSNYANPQFGYMVIPTSSSTKWEKLTLPVTAPYSGYAFVYLTNESNYNVFFDDFLIVHEKTTKSLRVTESADYYPFGLLIEGTRYVDESRLVNSYGYQGDFSEFDSRTGWNRFELRGNYDAKLGKWQSGDPFNQYASPFAGMGNNPVSGIDPNGGIFGLSPVLSGMLIGSAAGTVAGLMFDKDNWYWWTVAGAGIGAAAGAIIDAPAYRINMTGKKNPTLSSRVPSPKLPRLNFPRPKGPDIGSVGRLIDESLARRTPEILYSYLTYTGNSQMPNTGVLTWTDVWSDGRRVNSGTWSANSGTAVSNRPTPQADDWQVSVFRNRSIPGTQDYNPAMTRDGVGFSFDITPDPRFGRSELRIHPDGGVPGTRGCIGLTGSCDALTDFSNRMQSYLRINRSIRLRVRGTYDPSLVGGVGVIGVIGTQR